MKETKYLMQLRKYFIVWLFVCFTCVTYAYADLSQSAAARLTEQQQLISKITPFTDEFKQIDKDEAIQTKRWDDLKWSEAQLKKQIDEHKAEGAEFDKASEKFEAARRDHDSRCMGTFSDGAYVAACNKEAEAGDAEARRLGAWGTHLNEMQALLQKAIVNHSEETQKVFAKHKANTARMDEIRATVQPMLDRLKAIQNEVDTCVAAIKNSSDEVMHDTCGRMFDNNK